MGHNNGAWTETPNFLTRRQIICSVDLFSRVATPLLTHVELGNHVRHEGALWGGLFKSRLRGAVISDVHGKMDEMDERRRNE